MKARLYLREDGVASLLAEADLEVVPRGIYVVDGVKYQYTGQPTFYLEKDPTGGHYLHRVDLILEKV